jgi:ATP-dependent RNA circularization protein (DNA/RNA ligase family)
MTPFHRDKELADSHLDIEEVRLVSDLRIMHAKVAELREIIERLKKRDNEAAIVKYSDYELLSDDIQRVDEIYLWYVKVKEERDGTKH